MTTDEDTSACVQRYRASVDEVATPSLDRVILEAAARQATRRRFARHAGGASMLMAIVVSCAGVAWYAHRAEPSRPPVTNYGQIEGSTRPYLLQAGMIGLSRPGLQEVTP
jgi:ferric-dicitrate binding protein FerR (iron transport regulator)